MGEPRGTASPVDSTWEPQGVIAAFALSPDGQALAVDVIQNGNNAIWIKQIPTGPFSRLTFGDTANLRPTWSADGRSLVYIGDRDHQRRHAHDARAPTAPARAQPLLRSPFAFAQAFETHDGKWLVARRSFFEAGVGRHLRDPQGRLDAGAAGDRPGVGDRPRGIAGRAVAGVRVERVGRGRGVRAPLPRRRRRRGGRCRPLAARSGLVAQRQGAVLSERAGRSS